MKELCWFQATPLCHLMEENLPIIKCSKTDPVVWLDRLAAIFRHTAVCVGNCDDPHPCQGAVNEVS